MTKSFSTTLKYRKQTRVIEKEKKKVSLIDVTVQWDTRAKNRESQKEEKYQDLRMEAKRLWKMQSK